MAKVDIYQVVTDSLVAMLEKGRRPWSKPWDAPEGAGILGTLPINSKGKAYNGINVWILWAAAAEKGYTNPRWITFKQAKSYKLPEWTKEKSALRSARARRAP
jgi:antirestriction protein ArdC